jgi:hypothetical protein
VSGGAQFSVMFALVCYTAIAIVVGSDFVEVGNAKTRRQAVGRVTASVLWPLSVVFLLVRWWARNLETAVTGIVEWWRGLK